MALALVDEEEPVQPPEPPGPMSLPTFVVTPSEGLFAGHRLVFRYPSTKVYIASRRNELDEVGLWDEVLRALVEHDLGLEPAFMPPAYVTALAETWFKGLEDLAVPPRQGGG